MATAKFQARNRVNLLIAQLMMVVACLSGCMNRPTDAQLETWRKEAIGRNNQIVAVRANQEQQQEWQLAVQGQTATGKSVQLSWQQLQALATTHVRTQDANYIPNPKTIFDFRGVPISKLLDQFGTAVDEVTFVAFDSYQVTIKSADLRAYPIILALERDGQPIPRSQGGPLYLVFPISQYPELKQKYDDSFWVFYVTHMAIGTEPVQLRVGNREFDLSALDKLPQITLRERVGYRSRWPSGKVKLYGVRVRDVMAAAGIELPSTGAVIVRGKPPIYRDATKPVRLSAAAVRKCDILLATRWGNGRQPIPAKMGGPVTLAFPPTCPAQAGEPLWINFVEELNTGP